MNGIEFKELHMYKCCIEIKNKSQHKRKKELHMYKCCIEISFEHTH